MNATRTRLPRPALKIALLLGIAIATTADAARAQQDPPPPAAAVSERPASLPSADAAPAAVAAPPVAAAAGTSAASVTASRGHLPGELSPWGMFLAADVVVKAVMIFLAMASLLVWTAYLAKQLHLGHARRRLELRTREIMTADTLAAAAARVGDGPDPVAAMVRRTIEEIERSERGALPAAGIKDRIASQLTRIEAGAGRAMTSGTGILATVGSTAPFIGLFGTVWGIMNSFIGISKAQTTNLAVVAPGIAEALLATAIGLVAAIPAVMFYNQLARSIAGYKAMLADASAAVERLASRDLDRRPAVPRRAMAAE